jgi:Lanthionine synthetase C-like protein
VTETAASLYDPARHEALTATPWRESLARAAIDRIADAAVTAFDPTFGWRTHPLDDPTSPDEQQHSLYCGSGGAIWALEHLARAGAIVRRFEFGPFVANLVERNRRELGASAHGTASYLLGDAGLLLLQWVLTYDEAIADSLFAVVNGNLHNPVREALWGSPGTVLAAIHMAEATGQARWPTLVREAVQIIHDEMEPSGSLGGAWLWVQDFYGRQRSLLGAGHGFVGNVYPALRGAAMLEPGIVDAMLARALQTLQATALHDGELANWWPAIDTPTENPGKPPLMHDCHGAPGVVCRLASAPPTADWDRLLLRAGEAVWRAGPVAKGASLCHGTAGNGMVFLKLWRRTGDDLWRRRARAFAMHTIEQIERLRQVHGMGRHTLWTGDLGAACFLWNCVVDDDAYPTLDVF